MKNFIVYFALVVFIITTAFIASHSEESVTAEIPSIEEKDFARDETRASLTGGLLILISLGAGYGFKKVYDLRSRNMEEAEN
jgi:uncharacterized membrane protein YphA (DoxX/SURF4 family)